MDHCGVSAYIRAADGVNLAVTLVLSAVPPLGAYSKSYQLKRPPSSAFRLLVSWPFQVPYRPFWRMS
ncbi:hypothetical protein D3C81_1946920 [compost metagenome]